jgi:sporulation protein YlmC with PRC-barrel domain
VSTRYEHRPEIIGPEGYSENTRLPSFEDLEGMEVRDVDGDKIGKVEDSYTDESGGYARYLAVKTGWFGGKRHVIPVDDVRVERDGDDAFLRVPYTRGELEAAPTYEAGEDLTTAHESDVYRHYGRQGYWEEVRARQTTPAPTPEIAEAEVEDAIRRGDDPREVRVRRWGV